MKFAKPLTAMLCSMLSGIATADEYHSLGCYVGNMTREEFYRGKIGYPNPPVYYSQDPPRPTPEAVIPEVCIVNVGDIVECRSFSGKNHATNMYGNAHWRIEELYQDGSGAWRAYSKRIKPSTIPCYDNSPDSISKSNAADLYARECVVIGKFIQQMPETPKSKPRKKAKR